MVGTHVPFDMGEEDALGQVAKLDGITEDDRAAVSSPDARRIVHL